MTKATLGLVSWLVVCVGGGILVGVSTAGGESDWYQELGRPAWTPPSWVFGPVWTLLYVAMALAAWRVWRRGGWAIRAVPLAAFVLQLGLNFAWSLIFFGVQRVDWALVDIVLLWTMIIVTIRLFATADRYAGWLLVPYLAWVTFAMALNAEIYRLLP